MKLYFTRRARLLTKYGPRASEVSCALERLCAWNAERGLPSQVVDLSTDPEAEARRAVRELRPTAVTLIGASDVIPHVQFDNPLYEPRWPYRCPDRHVLTDLAWAATRSHDGDLHALLRETAACCVARIPDVVDATVPDVLLRTLQLAAARQRAPAPAGEPSCFALCARALTDETRRCLSHAELACEPLTGRANALRVGELARPYHLLNAHGDAGRPLILDQDARGREILLCSDDLSGAITPGTVVASLCCFGSALFAPTLAQGRLPLPNAYLLAGAAGFFGPTCGTFGSPSAERYASLLTGLFLRERVRGSELARAAAAARVRYLQHYARSLHAMDLVVLSQYTLLGDPAQAR